MSMAGSRGVSLTPADRSDEVTKASFHDGLMSGILTLIPSVGGVWYGSKFSPAFRKATNYQSRTAIAIMPALFVFGFVSETTLNTKMKEMAGEKEQANKVSQWAERKLKEEEQQQQQATNAGVGLARQTTEYAKLSPEDREKRLSQLYMQSVGGAGVRIVKGDSLGFHHKIANFWQENPFKILAGVGIPSVAYIFHQRQKKGHLALQQQIMQTRVVGQFTVLIFLLSLMGFKEYMDQNGKFITEEEAHRRVEDIRAAKKELQFRLDEDMRISQHRMELVKKAHEHHEEAKANRS